MRKTTRGCAPGAGDLPPPAQRGQCGLLPAGGPVLRPGGCRLGDLTAPGDWVGGCGGGHHRRSAGEELLEELEAYFEERREIAVDIQVRAPETKTVDVTVSVAAQTGWDQEGVLQGVEDALEGWFTGERLGQSVLLAQLGNLIYQCDGVANYSITAPAADVAVDSDELPCWVP